MIWRCFGTILLCVAGMAVTGAGAAETHDLGPYQVIIDRSPFGAVPGLEAADVQPDFATRFVLVGIVDSNGVANALQAIILDKQKNITHFKGEGETIDEVTVLHITDKPPKVVIQRGLETATLTFPEKAPSGSGLGPQPGNNPGFPSPGPGRMQRIPFRRGS